MRNTLNYSVILSFGLNLHY